MERRKSGCSGRLVLLLLAAAGLGFLGVWAFRTGAAPAISIEPSLPAIGKRTPVRVQIEQSDRGLSALRVEVVQGDRVKLLDNRTHAPLEPWQFWGERKEREDFVVEVGSETVPGLTEGQATIRVVADRPQAFLRHPDPAVFERTLEVRLRPPALEPMSTHVYVSQGGCEAVVYRVGPTSVEDGVQAGDWWFPGHPLPGGGERQRFALFAAPYDLTDPARIRLVARDDVGNEARAAIVDRFTPKPFQSDTIRLSEEFMARVVPAILAQTPGVTDRGGLLENYLEINGVVRRQNAETLVELSRASAEKFFWSRPFVPMRNAKVMSNFADRRTYVYEGRPVDRQDHLGFDLASTRQAEVQAANDGVVVLARYFGIYGNAVVIDHGYGLMSLYGHLSSLGVSEGQTVERGAPVGRSGETGLAGGDHLHFTMMLAGLPVEPREWWDGHWIHDRIALKLGAAMPFVEN